MKIKLSEKLLNMSCVFKCSCCPTVKIKPNDVTQLKVNAEGQRVLTTGTMMNVITPGACPFSEIPPNQSGITCIPRVIAGHWEKTSKHVVGGKNLLIESSEFICEASRLKGGDGRITVDINPITKVAVNSYGSQALSKVDIKDKKNNGYSEKEKKNNDNSNKKIEEPKYELLETQIGNEVSIVDLYCPYDSTKEKCGNCKYANSDSKHMLSAKKMDSDKTPGAILRDNYEKNFQNLSETRKKYLMPCETLKEEYQIFEMIGCGNQAHHILSTKDVYEQDKLSFVLKLANFYDYDVNEAYNCIILPAYNSKNERKKNELQVSFGKSSDFDKRSSKYMAMRKSGRQWHGGGHGNDFENSQNISCYATEVTDFLYQCMKKLDKDHCRAEEKYYESDRQEFILKLHKALDYVRNKLISFDSNPQNSLPFYVSKDAYEYAYAVANVRVLVFQKDGELLKVYKYMFTRKAGETSPDERGVKEFDMNSEISKKKLVVFCEQINVAYMDRSKGQVSIPFTIDNVKEVDMKDLDVFTYFKNNISVVEAEIIDYGESAENVMRKRLNEIRS